MKMALDVATISFVQSNISLLTDMEILLKLIVVMALLEAIHSLIKFAQLKDVFVTSK
jgi:competence protein ComGF